MEHTSIEALFVHLTECQFCRPDIQCKQYNHSSEQVKSEIALKERI
ncbi:MULTISPECIES: hypothetical protein [Bacillaceae]|nr:hypothetical protein [Rossellomorea sp. YZS02]MBW3113309.1 hypothetical protein [Bacillus sp. MCCB 382]MDX8345560.1 hypothetical protein [Rossellomorea sp. YZS02]